MAFASSSDDRLLAERIEEQAFHVVAQPLHVGAAALREQTRGGRIDRGSRGGDAVADPALGIGLVLEHAAIDERRVLREQLEHPAAFVDRSGDEDESGPALRVP